MKALFQQGGDISYLNATYVYTDNVVCSFFLECLFEPQSLITGNTILTRLRNTLHLDNHITAELRKSAY